MGDPRKKDLNSLGGPQDEAYLVCFGAPGHRGPPGAEMTLRNLKQRFDWTGMDAEVENWRTHCLQCLKLYNGDFVPRLLGFQLLAEYPGKIVSIDYIKLGATRTGYKYVLMLVDRMKRLVMFVPAGKPTAILAARTLLKWGAQHGLPKWIISDGGSHSNNAVLKELTTLMGIHHHITLVYCPWANDSVEVVGIDLLWTLRALTSEFHTGLDEWDLLSPLIEFTIE